LDLIESRMSAITQSVAAAFGVSAKFNFDRLYPALINHHHETIHATEAMLATVEHDQVHANIDRAFASEDFSFFLQHKPGCYAFLGNGELWTGTEPANATSHQLHSPLYDFNDDIIGAGIAYWVALVRRCLGT